MNLSENQAFRAIRLFRLVGYGLIVLFVLDAIHLVVPLRLTDPNWEMATMGAFIERLPVALLGWMLVFYGDDLERRDIEFWLLRLLSWAALLMAVFYLLMLPLLGVNTMRIARASKAQYKAQLNRDQEQIQQVSRRVQTAADLSQLQQVLNQEATMTAGSSQNQSVEMLRQEALEQLGRTQIQVFETRNQQRQQQQWGLVKNSVKWLLGALVGGVLWVWIWRATLWARLRRG